MTLAFNNVSKAFFRIIATLECVEISENWTNLSSSPTTKCLSQNAAVSLSDFILISAKFGKFIGTKASWEHSSVKTSSLREIICSSLAKLKQGSKSINFKWGIYFQVLYQFIFSIQYSTPILSTSSFSIWATRRETNPSSLVQKIAAKNLVSAREADRIVLNPLEGVWDFWDSSTPSTFRSVKPIKLIM